MLDKVKLALEFYTMKPEYKVDEQGRRVTTFIPRTDGSDFVAKEALKELNTFIESNGWQDISEADSKYKDTEIIGCIEYAEGKFGEPFSCFYNHEEERFQSCRITELMPHIPTHFTPLPAIKSIKE